MTDVGGVAIAPGWYPDSSGAPRQRWWDGVQWTEHIQPWPPAVQTSVPPSLAYAAPAGAGTSAMQRVTQPQLIAPKINTVFIWLIALMPLIMAIWAGANYFVSRAVNASTTTNIPAEAFLRAGDFTIHIVYVVSILFAILDHRALKRAGIVRPFHWAWAFATGPVYVIGRSVIVRMRVGFGMLPMWVLLAELAFGAVAFVLFAAIFLVGMTFI